MSNNKNNHQIIFIYRNRLFFCDPSQGKSLEFPISTDIIKDLEIVDEAKLQKSLVNFLKDFQAGNNETLIILNKNTYFRTTIDDPNTNPIEVKNKIDEFSDLMPFDDIFVKQFNLKKKLEIIAISREFYEPILDILYKLNFKITMILPDLVVEDLVGEASCTPEENENLLKVLGKLAPYDLLGKGHKLLTKDSEIEPIKERNKRLKILVVVFGFLIIILLGAIIFNANRTYEDDYLQPSLTNANKVIAPVVNQDPSESSQSAQASDSAKLNQNDQESSPSANLNLDQYKLRVLNGSGISGQAAVVKNDLEKAGFTNIDIGNAQKISSNKTQIIFLPSLPATVKKLVLDTMENLGQEYSIQENSELNYDIVITTTATE